MITTVEAACSIFKWVRLAKNPFEAAILPACKTGGIRFFNEHLIGV
jgi:hypothetical protein